MKTGTSAYAAFKISKREEHTRRIAEGLCTQCGQNPADPGRRSCWLCLVAARDRSARSRINRPPKKRKSVYNSSWARADREKKLATKTCQVCRRRALSNSRLCLRHRDLERRRARKYWRKKHGRS